MYKKNPSTVATSERGEPNGCKQISFGEECHPWSWLFQQPKDSFFIKGNKLMYVQEVVN